MLYLPIICLTLLILLSSCVGVDNYYFTVPDNYTGYLIIRYDCPNGIPATRKGSDIYFEFQRDGTLCIKDSHPQTHRGGAWTIKHVQTISGEDIRAVVDVNNTHGTIFFGGSTMQSGDAQGTVLATFSIWWVGDANEYQRRERTNVLNEQLYDKLAYFGVRRDGEFQE
jgi:hypothetical protein